VKAFRHERLFTGSLLLGISAVIALMIASIFVTRNTSEEQRDATARVLHTLDVLGHVDEIRALVTEAEAAQRGFILSNDTDYFEPFAAAARATESCIDDLEKLTADNPPQRARTQRLRGLVRERLKQMDEVLMISKERGLMAARQALLASHGKGSMAAIREVVLALKSTENERLTKRLRTADVGYDRSRSLNLFAGALGLLALGAFVYLVDKTLRARETAAEEIARQRETLRVTLASIGDGVITTDTLGRVVFLNAEAERLTGWETAEAAGKRLERIFNIVHEDTRQSVDNPASSALRDGVVVGLAHRTLLVGRDGVERPIDDIAAPIRDSQGKVAGVVLVFRDVTEDRAATNELRKLASELSEADRRKNEFLAMLAHEIRNPLAAIRNSAAVLKLAGRDPQAAVSAQGAIDRQMEHLVRLIEDLLDVARISRGKLELRRTRMDLRLALEQALEVSRPLCADNEQALEVEIPPTPLYVHGDAVRITQAIANLLNNACKFTPRGGRIRVSVGVEDRHAIVRIRDDGIGIAPEHLPRLFDMFSQIDTSLERTQGGLGIGLNLVKQLVEMHGGRVEVRSEGVGTGSEFIVHFPVNAEDVNGTGEIADQPAALPQGASPRAEMAAAAPPRAPAKGRRILVVDDNADSADSLVMLLRLLGHEAEVARDGVEAVETALRTRPDVVLLDIGLPRLNGFEAARRIRLSPHGRGVKLIAVTGWGQDEDRDLSRSAGFDEHLVKPVDIDRLDSLLRDSAIALPAG
jgi:PAS domain S-box-containing protein